MSNNGMGKPIPTPAAWSQPLADYTLFLSAANRPATTQKLRLYHLRRFAATTGVEPYEAIEHDLLTYMGRHAWDANTRRSVRSSLRSFYTWAHAKGRISVDPSHGMPIVTGTPGRPRPASESAVAAGVTAIDRRVRLMVTLGARVGLRCCEIAKVSLTDIRPDLMGYSLLVHGKGNKKRIVPLNDQVVGAIRDYVALEGLTGYLFPGQIDGHLSAGYVSKIISAVLPEGVTAHMLRHRFGSRAFIGSNNDLLAVQRLLGHASVATTQIYVAVPDDALRAGVNAA
ncbi:tyrosine-type recombinase/integrase [Leifsonia sp. ALI-44-B]|uniref:tyrosine-type recombinase/integrase n=1 Tax=Leifsonia sp. ALI-44-B TaxID=1933776 RepID=UPI0015C4045B|nr:tyrosine-type recombinase/integrase [Leifsonia sp. ALI-44-B]